jgi:multiple sugar transport system substrate-binding protein
LVAADNYDLSVFYSHAIDGCRHEGKLYAVPFLIHPGGGSLVLFNLDLFAEAGIDPPTEDWKLSDLVQISKALTKEDQWGFAGGEPGGAQHFLFYQQLAHSFGSDLLSEDGRTCIIDDDKNMETLWWIYDLFNEHKSSPKPSEIPEGHWAAFSSGYVAMFRTGYWGINLEKDVPASDTPFEVGALQMPWGPAQSRGALYQIDYDCMSAKTKHPEMAWEFLKLAVTHEAGMAIGWCCGARPSVWSHPDKMQYAIHRAGRSAMEEAVLLRMPTNFRGQEIEEAMGQNMFAIYEGEKTPNEHVDTLKEIIQEILDKPMT